MSQHECQSHSSASTDVEFSITMSVPNGTGGRVHERFLVTFTTEFDLEVDFAHPLISDEINRIIGSDDLPSSFARLLGLGDLASDPEILGTSDSEFSTHRSPDQSRLTTVNDASGQPIRQLKQQESVQTWERMKYARLRSRFLAILIAELLDGIGQRYHADPDTLPATFRTQFISERESATFARALQYFWQGHYDDAVRVTLPSIEAVIRSIAEATSGNSYVEPKRNRDGHESSLGRLLEMLSSNLPESFQWELRAILTDPLGLNLRNIHLHGLAKAESKHDAAVILYTAARLTLIRAQH